MLLGYQTGGETTGGALPADPRQRWRVFFVDEADEVATDMSATWVTAENYNPAHPFPAVDEVVLSVPGLANSSQVLRGEMPNSTLCQGVCGLLSC
jgi:hypothetical protein